ncbi:MAG TPA: hypothetical protein DEP69_02165, partial [Acidimicrobiaceae bacterium]|nr:hypothetical protein [Acidimicrobiaceae bacterium]
MAGGAAASSTVRATGIEVSAVGFGRPARTALAQLIVDAKADDPLAPVTVVTGRAGRLRLLRRLVATGAAGPGGLAAVATLSFAQVAENVMARRAEWSARRIAGELALGGVVRLVLAGDEGLFAGVAHHPATERSLQRVARELGELTDEQLDLVAAGSERSGAVVDLCRRV